MEDCTATALKLSYLFSTPSAVISVITYSKTNYLFYAKTGRSQTYLCRKRTVSGREVTATKVSSPQVAYLGCHKVCSITGSHEKAVLSPQLLGKAKVTNANALRVP